MIVYSLVARGTLILAEFTSHTGDFPNFARRIISTSKKQRSKTTYFKDDFAFVFFTEDEFTFLCMNKSSVPRDTSFKFLDQLAELFYSEQKKQDDGRSWSAYFSGKIKSLMEEYDETAPKKDKLDDIESDLRSATETAQQNIEGLLIRTSQLEDIKNKTSVLKQSVNYSNMIEQYIFKEKRHKEGTLLNKDFVITKSFLKKQSNLYLNKARRLERMSMLERIKNKAMLIGLVAVRLYYKFIELGKE